MTNSKNYSKIEHGRDKEDALSACVEIFRRFNNEDIKTMHATVQRAWGIGKKADGVNS